MQYLIKSVIIGFALLGLTLSFHVASQQEHFYKNYIAEGIEFHYQWTANDGSRELKFLIPHADIESLPNSAPAYNSLLAQNYIHRNLLEYAKTIDPRVAKIVIKRSGASLNMEVSGRSRQKINEITDTLSSKQQQAEADYLAKNYYMPFTDELGQLAIKQDHRRYALESSSNLSNIVNAIKAQMKNPNNSREYIDFVLNWLQTIPYDTLQNRMSSNGSGFAAPRQLLINNKGDCDSKSTLFLALLKSYNAQLTSKMVFLPNHALVAVNLKPNKTDKFIIVEGTQYILAEPTGAAQYPLGEIAPESNMAIRNRQYTSENF